MRTSLILSLRPRGKALRPMIQAKVVTTNLDPSGNELVVEQRGRNESGR